MPKGNPSKNTIYSEKYAKTHGWVSKSYKLRKETVDRFSTACEERGCSMSSKLMELMEGFISETENIKNIPS